MKKQVFFIHGGHSYTNHKDFMAYLKIAPIRNLPGNEEPKYWYKNLGTDLGSEYEVFKLSMPNCQNANYEEWALWFERHFDHLRDDVILVGWSLGGMFLAKYLSEQRLPFQIEQLHLIAAPFGIIESEDGDDCGNFQFEPRVLCNLANLNAEIYIWHSKDDIVVPYEHALNYQTSLPKAKFTLFTDKNHFLSRDFSELIKAISTK